MAHSFETLPNEILILIISNLSWFEILTSFWSINKRINCLICSIFSMNNTRYNNGIAINQPGLSYVKCSSFLLPAISDSSSLSFSIRRIHFDERNSNSSEFIHKWLFNDGKQIHRFYNLKSLILTRCLLSESLIKSLSILVELQLDELKLTFDKDIFVSFNCQYQPLSTINNSRKLLNLFHEFLSQILSGKSQLVSFQLGATDSSCGIDQCLTQHSNLFSNTICNELQSRCMTLRYLNIHVPSICFLENLIERIPNLERLSISSQNLLRDCHLTGGSMWRPKLSSTNWFDKIPKLRYFTLKSELLNDSEFAYLKWLLNNLNYIRKLRLHLENPAIYRPDQLIWQSPIDATFIRQYCLPDTICDLVDFNFYISSKRQLSSDDIANIIHSFKVDSFYISRQWTNVKCLYDPNTSHQHLFSSDNTVPLFDGLNTHQYVFEWPYIRNVWINLHPSLYLFLERLEEFFPNVSAINVHTESYVDKSKILIPLVTPFQLGQRTLTDIKFRNVTKLQFGVCCDRETYSSNKSIEKNQARAKVFAHLISMPVQLKHLIVGNFEWLLHVVQYASNELETNAFNSVRYAEFGIPSCHHGDNESIHIGQQLVPFLSSYMSRIHTLRLWRPDDFPWTSIRPDFKPMYLYHVLIRQWKSSLRTSQSLAQHATIFEQDLNQLVEQLKQFVFLDICGKICLEKVEVYRLMVQNRFPNSQINVETSRFRLWF